jgi:hypothetical protein
MLIFFLLAGQDACGGPAELGGGGLVAWRSHPANIFPHVQMLTFNKENTWRIISELFTNVSNVNSVPFYTYFFGFV